MTRRHKNARLKCLDPYTELVELIERWVIHDLHEASGSLGYPRQSLQVANIRVLASSIDPTGYSAEDHRVVAEAVESLGATDDKLFAAVCMYYKPWMLRALAERGYPEAPTQTFYDRLVRAHSWIDSTICAKRPQKSVASC